MGLFSSRGMTMGPRRLVRLNLFATSVPKWLHHGFKHLTCKWRIKVANFRKVVAAYSRKTRIFVQGFKNRPSGS